MSKNPYLKPRSNSRNYREVVQTMVTHHKDKSTSSIEDYHNTMSLEWMLL